MIIFMVKTLIEHVFWLVQTLQQLHIKRSTSIQLADAWKTVLKLILEIIRQEDATRPLNSVHTVGATILTTAVFIIAPGQLPGIHLETIPPDFALSFVLKASMPIPLQALVNAFLSVLESMIFMETKQALTIHSVTMKTTDVRLSVWLLGFSQIGILIDANPDAQVTLLLKQLQHPALNDQLMQTTSTKDVSLPSHALKCPINFMQTTELENAPKNVSPTVQ